MSIKNKAYQFREETHQIISDYKEILYQSVSFLRDSKNWLEFKKLKEIINDDVYYMRLKSLINMALVYFYSLYEGFTRAYFKNLTLNDFGLKESEFNRKFSAFHDIVKNLMKDIYKIHIPKNIFSNLKMLRDARHRIAHGVKNAKSDFAIVEICYQTLLEYFRYMENRITVFSKRLQHQKFTEKI